VSGTWAWFAAALLLRAAVAFATELPSEDGVLYLTMAADLARGDLRAALGEVFHPGLPALAAPGIWCGLDPLVAARIVLVLGGAASVIGVRTLTRRLFGGYAGGCAALVALVSVLPCRFVGDVYSEPLFLAALAHGLAAHVAGRPTRAGLLLGAAFWVRPEALAALGVAALADRRSAVRLLAAGIPVVAALPLLRFAVTGDLAVTPKLAYMAPLGPLAAPDAGTGIARFFEFVLRAAGELPEALGVLPTALVVGGIVLALYRRQRVGVLLGTAVLMIAAMAMFEVKSRFLVDVAPCLWPFAGLCVAALARPTPAIVLGALAGIDLSRLAEVRRADKVAEADVARFLAGRLAPDDVIVTDFPRLLYYAGRRPLPPAHTTVGQILERARRPAAAVAVIGARRETARAAMGLAGLGFEVVRLPQELAAEARDRMIVLARPGRLREGR
jgi:hypothetical protein